MAQNPLAQNPVEDKPSKNNNRTEWFQFIIALIIIVPFMIYVGAFHASGMTQEAKDILTMLGVFVGAIVGFYFGQRPIQNLTKQIEKESSQKAEYKTISAETVNTAINKAETIREYRAEVIDLSKMLDEQATRYESIMKKQSNIYESRINSIEAQKKVNKPKRRK